MTLDLQALHAALTALPGFAGLPAEALAPLPVKGLAHDHVAVTGHQANGCPALLRVPKQSQFALAAADNLAYQAACFERVSRSGHGPRLLGVIEPAPGLPLGALLVEHIHGRPPRLPADLPALAEAMARVHALPLPEPAARPPLADHENPVGGALAEIEAQAAFLDEAGLVAEARAEIDDELAWARHLQKRAVGQAQPVTLVLTDTHPGNFLVEAAPNERGGRAVIVDLEKALYGSPGTDLAHATVYSSTTWDTETWADLSVEQVAAFYRRYLAILEPEQAERLRPWLLPMRRLLFLRAITWCAKWSVLHRQSRRRDLESVASTLASAPVSAPVSTEDWSAENSDPALIAHVAGRVADYLSAASLRRMRGEWRGHPSLDSLIQHPPDLSD